LNRLDATRSEFPRGTVAAADFGVALRLLQPMLATTRPPTEPAEWVFEPKLDGWRRLVYIDETVTVRTRTGRDITSNVPHLQSLATIGRRLVLGRGARR
jgi:ATP-dependent DNA ligase